MDDLTSAKFRQKLEELHVNQKYWRAMDPVPTYFNKKFSGFVVPVERGFYCSCLQLVNFHMKSGEEIHYSKVSTLNLIPHPFEQIRCYTVTRDLCTFGVREDISRKQVCCAGYRRTPFPMQLYR